MLLSRYVAIGRETTDLDFLAMNISNRIDDLPLRYSDEQIAQLQVFWESYLRSMQKQKNQILPRDIAQVILALNEWLLALAASN